MSTNIHRVFISYHHTKPDQQYRNEFERLFNDAHGVLISESVQIGDIDPNTSTERTRQIIRDEYLRDSTVTVVLIGQQTWQRKHVDWEISSSIRDTEYNPRSGLLGIFLPTYPLSIDNKYNPNTIPPRLYDNVKCGFAKVYKWSNDPNSVQSWIQEAFDRRKTVNPDNSFPSFVNNRVGDQWSP